MPILLPKPPKTDELLSFHSAYAGRLLKSLHHLECAGNNLIGLNYHPVSPFEKDDLEIQNAQSFLKSLFLKHELQWLAITHATLHLESASICGDRALLWSRRHWKKYRWERCRAIKAPRIQSWANNAQYSHHHLFDSVIWEKDIRNAYRLYSDEIYDAVSKYVPSP